MAATVLVEWFAGPRAVLPSPGLALECPELHWPARHQWSWLAAFRDSNEPGAVAQNAQVAGVVSAVLNLPRTVTPNWAPPPLSIQDQQAAAERADNDRRRELARQMAANGA